MVSVPLDTPSMWLFGLNARKVPLLALGLIDWPIAPAFEGSETLQSRTVLSLPPLARVRPVRLKVSDTTASVWPLRLLSAEASEGSSMSQSLTELSSPPLASVCPSGL
ncbi:hypothetical protein SVIOM74S_08753 [Streptomyces violarus]